MPDVEGAVAEAEYALDELSADGAVLLSHYVPGPLVDYPFDTTRNAVHGPTTEELLAKFRLFRWSGQRARRGKRASALPRSMAWAWPGVKSG